MKNIEQIRQEINDIDNKLIELFEKRMDLAEDVVNYKIEKGLPILDEKREQQVLDKVRQLISNSDYKDFAVDLFKHIMDYSKDYQKKLLQCQSDNQKIDADLVLFQGMSGSYSEEAALAFFNETTKLTNVARFEDVAIGVKDGTAMFGVLPLENSSTGSILDVYDILRQYDCFIVGEVVLNISHNLLGSTNATIEDIKQVYSHPQGFEQCTSFLKLYPHWECVPYHNTANSAQLVSKSNDPSKAAIASERAGKIHGLKTLAKSINNNYNNTTRFIVISSKQMVDKEANKISVLLQIKHKQGELYRVLSHLAANGLNMLKIESRPIQGKKWEYSFYIDVEGSLADEKTLNTIKTLEKDCSYFKLLGNYKAAQI